MKIALCFFGQPRFIHNKHVVNSVYDNILNKYNTDVYCHFWYDKEIKNYDTSDWNKNNNRVFNVYSDSNTKIIEYYEPKKIFYEPPLDFKNIMVESWVDSIKNKPYFSINNLNNLLSHLYSLEMVLNMVDGDYDYVIMNRYDNLIRKIPNLNEEEKNKVFSTNHYVSNIPNANWFSDAIVICDYSLIDVFKIYNKKELIFPLTDKVIPECVKKESIKHSIGEECIKYVDLLAGIVRTDNDMSGQI